MAYTYDAFISYRNKPLVGRWTRQHLRALIEKHVGEELGRDIAVFVDRDMPQGASWRDTLGDALLRSRIMIGVWSTRYFFDSAWCPAEFESMLRRDAAVGRGLGTTERSLVYPIVVNDGDRFPDPAQGLVYSEARMHDYLIDADYFPQSPLFMAFERHVKRIAPAIAALIESAPPWQSWPLVEPVQAPRRSVAMPRIMGGG